jgi:hypothetical protein
VKVLLDVCTPVQVRSALLGHDVYTAVKLGWGELENGELLRVAEQAEFDLLILCDKNLRHQQNLGGRSLTQSRKAAKVQRWNRDLRFKCLLCAFAPWREKDSSLGLGGFAAELGFVLTI